MAPRRSPGAAIEETCSFRVLVPRRTSTRLAGRPSSRLGIGLALAPSFISASPSLLALVVAVVLASAAPAQADDPDFLSFSLGGYDVNDDEDAVEARLEYRSDIKLWIFKPFSGVMLTSESAAYGYGGILLDLYFGRRLVATPSFAVGLYHNGAGKDLGHAVEFRSQIELAYRFNDRSRLAVSFSHTLERRARWPQSRHRGGGVDPTPCRLRCFCRAEPVLR